MNALTEEKIIQYSPDTGVIEGALLHFPLGCSSLVEIIIYHKKKQILPELSEESRMGIALDDATEWFNIDEPVTRDDPIEVRFINHDDTHPHTPTVVIYVRPGGGD